MAAPLAFGEALVLGLASGPACVASCGPVIVPALLAEHGGLRMNSRYLSLFLATRLLGYLLFAAIAWELGALVTIRSPTHSLLFALIHVLLGCALLAYAYSVGRPCAHACTGSELVTIGAWEKHKLPGAGVLGFLTGVSPCPPFVVASVRAAEAASIAAALLFFAAFFLGTSIWFVPFVGLGLVKRNEAVTTVARMAMVLIALYYFYVGLTMLVGRSGYGS